MYLNNASLYFIAMAIDKAEMFELKIPMLQHFELWI